MGYFLLKYWNKPFVLEIYIRVTKKNCIYTIKIGYGLTLIQKSYVKSPLGFLSFQTSANDTDDGNAGVSIPFGVFTLPNYGVDLQIMRLSSFQSPLGCLLFQTASLQSQHLCGLNWWFAGKNHFSSISPLKFH